MTRSRRKLERVSYSSSLGERRDVLDAFHDIHEERDGAAAAQTHILVLCAEALEQVLEQDRDEARPGRVLGAPLGALRGECKLLDGVRRVRREELAYAVRGRDALLHVQHAVHAAEEALVERLLADEARAAWRLLGELCALRVQAVQADRVLPVIRDRVLRVLEVPRELRLHAARERRAVHRRGHVDASQHTATRSSRATPPWPAARCTGQGARPWSARGR